MLVLAGVLVWRGKRPVASALATIGALLIVVMLAIGGLLVVAQGSARAPFIYTIF
jgi:hypothetical protein